MKTKLERLKAGEEAHYDGKKVLHFLDYPGHTVERLVDYGVVYDLGSDWGCESLDGEDIENHITFPADEKEEASLEEKLEEIIKRHDGNYNVSSMSVVKELKELLPPRSVVDRLMDGEKATYRGMEVGSIIQIGGEGNYTYKLKVRGDECEHADIYCTKEAIKKNVKFV